MLNKKIVPSSLRKFIRLSERPRNQKVLVLAVALLVIGVVGALGARATNDSHAATGGKIYLSPQSANVAPGSNITVSVHVDSLSTGINAVQAALSYDSSKLQYLGLTEGMAFPTNVATDAGTPGSLKLARGTSANTSVTGDNMVVSISFRVLAASGTASIAVNSSESLIGVAADGTNMLSSVVGANYTVSSNTGSAALSLNPASGSYIAGDDIVVKLHEDSGSDPVNVVQTELHYDPSQLQFVGLTEGSVFNMVAATDTATPGVIRVARNVPAGTAVSGGQDVLQVRFKVASGVAAGTAAVTLNGANSYVIRASDSANILTGTTGANYAVKPPAPAPTVSGVTPNRGLLDGGTAVTISGAHFVAGAKVLFNGAQASQVQVVNDTTITAAAPAGVAGAATVQVVNPDGKDGSLASAYTYLARPGDANNDGHVNAIDLSMLISHDATNYPPADFNGDGTIGAADMAILLANWTW